MPLMDGWAFRREQRRDPRLANITVIVTSAADKGMSPDLFFDTVFAKPDIDQIIARVRQLCTPAAT
jgi:CheY-like chemotaxis protein